uniref:Uncharacterized protein n=1 Tax=Ignisphaera aggregans TaxID=334771 RepID=A0A7C2VNM0_9CREN
MPNFIVVIEHLEPCINKWILKEYEYAAKIFGSRLIITNVSNPEHATSLSKYFIVRKESAVDLLRDHENVIVLDPRAPKTLSSQELRLADYVVIGGIMGSHPPKGRTWFYITSRLPKAKPRNIGKHQYTIAGTAYVLKKIEEGKDLSEVMFVYGLSIKKRLSDIEIEIVLPYAFPVEDDGVVLPDDYIELISEYLPVYESRILRDAEDRICYNP